MEGTRPPAGASPTQPYKCSQNVKIKTALSLILTLSFDFKILTAFIRLGRARPVGAGCPPYYYIFGKKKRLTSLMEKNHFLVL
jgi:hypothetical protein